MVEEMNHKIMKESMPRFYLIFLIVVYYMSLVTFPVIGAEVEFYSIIANELLPLYTLPETVILIPLLFLSPIFYIWVKKRQANSKSPFRHLIFSFSISILLLTNFIVFALFVLAMKGYSQLGFGYYICLFILMGLVYSDYRCLRIMINGKKEKIKSEAGEKNV